MDTAANQLRTPDLAPEGPTYEDGNLNAQPSAPPAPAATQQQEPEPKAEPQPWKDDKRAEIFARAREKRASQMEPFSGDPNDPNVLYGVEPNHDDMGELEKEALRRRQEHLGQIAGQQGQQGQQPEQPQRKPLNGIDPTLLSKTVPIIVDGEQIEVPVESLVRDFQINRAADKRFEQSKALLAQVQEFQRVNAQPAPAAEYPEPRRQDDAASPDDGFEQSPEYTTRRPANVKELVEKIQLGTPDEAAQALEDFVSSAVNRQPQVDETTRVLTALEDANARQAVLSFAEQNPQIASNPILQQEATKEIHRNMALDLINAGYTMDQLRQMAPDPQSLTALHKQARVNKMKGVRQVSDLINAGYQGAVENLRSLVGSVAPRPAPNQAPSMQQRQQRKESLQPQPAARRLSPGMSAPTQQRSQEQSRAAAVARMRQARGQPY